MGEDLSIVLKAMLDQYSLKDIITQINDLSGKTVLAGHSNAKTTQVDASNLQTGIYLVTMTQDGIVSTSKLIKY